MRSRTAVAALAAVLVALAVTPAATQDKVTWFMYWFSPDLQQRAWVASEGYEAEDAVVLVFSRIANDSTRRLVYVRELYDCPGKRVAVEIRREFDMASQSKLPVFEREYDNPVSSLRAITPGSREALLYPGVCSTIGPRARPWPDAANYFREYSEEVEKLFASRRPR